MAQGLRWTKGRRGGKVAEMKHEKEDITLADILLCVLTWVALGLGLAYAF